MFTGLVEGQGRIARIQREDAGIRLSIEPASDCFASRELSLGDSVAISGCCLTVVAITETALDFEAGLETLSKTSLGQLQEGDFVNLERSLAVGARLGGHFVQGHVDGTAVVESIKRNGEWIDMWFACEGALTELMVPKGSVTVDGISLTVVNVDPHRFSVALIPHTLEVTTLGRRQQDDLVNIEQDILGKYVQKLLTGQKDSSLFGDEQSSSQTNQN